MPLKTRITLLVVAAVFTLWAAFAAIFYLREQELTRRYHDSLLQAQRIAWNKLQSESVRELEQVAQRLLAQPGWNQAWHEQDRQAMGELIRKALGGQPQWRADVFDSRRTLLYSSSTDLSQDSLVESGWIARALLSNRTEAGLSQVSRQRYYLVAARGFGSSDTGGVVAIGLDASSLLPELAGTLGGESFLLNLRGREVAGTQPGLVAREQLELSVRQEQVGEGRAANGAQLLSVLQPLTGPDKRRVGGLLLVRDVSTQREGDRRTAALAFAGGLALLLVLAVSVFAYLRRAMRPLERSVQVLGALSQGDLRAALDEDDQALPNEAGQIARGVAALRGEMLNLQMLREERIRTRQQQERLIRRQLKLLAESLDESSRVEILKALEPEQAEGRTSSDNDLAELARILGQMSGLVTTQQDRLVGLLKELRSAMEQQAILVTLQQELEIARSMQLSILPRQAPATDAVQVAALMIPAKEVGGDFYDYFLIDDDHLALVVADVSGKGIPAAFFMAISRTLLKSNALYVREPAQVVARLNDQLCAENEQMMFVTVFFGVLRLSTGEMSYVNAGHNPPLIGSRLRGVDMLPKGQNMALAVMDELSYITGQVTLAKGDTLLLYTDGVTEATNRAGELFGEARLVDIVGALHDAGDDLPQAVLRAVREFENGAAQADDITCVAVRYGVAG